MLTSILLVGVIAALVVIALQLNKLRKTNPFGNSINEALDQLENATRAHTEITAVLSLVETMHERPELMNNITPFTRDVWAAALVNRVNNLSAALSETESKLLKARRTNAHYAGDTLNAVWSGREVDKLENICSDLLTKLEAATKAAQAVNGLRVV